MFTEILMIVVPSSIASVIAWILGRRKYKAETRSSELDNVEKAAKIWRELSEQLEGRLKHDINELKSENGKMREENNLIREQFSQVQQENRSLKEQMESLEKRLKEANCDNMKLLAELKKFNKNYTPTKE